MADSDLKVDKDAVAATVHLSNGDILSGTLWVAQAAESHAGRERVKDVLNRDEPMLPFSEGHDRDRVRLLNKAHVIYVALDQPDLATTHDAEDIYAALRAVLLRMSVGADLRGELAVTTPPERSRTLDFLNRGQQFFYLRGGAGVRVVNLAFVLSIEER